VIIAPEGNSMKRYAGLDWASEIHAVCVIDEGGEVHERLRIPHTRLGLAELVSRLARHAEPAELPVGVERSDGPLVEALRAAGFPVVVIPPHVVKAARPRFSAARAKSDPGDARLLADLVRTDGGRFRVLAPSDPATAALRRLVRTRGELVAERTRLANRLRALLEDAWPGAAEVFARVDSPIGLDFLERYPSPRSARALGEARLASFLVRHHYCGRRTATELLARLRAAPVVTEPAIVDEATADAVRALVACLRAILARLADLEGAIRAALAAHPDGVLFRSFPRAGEISAAQLLAEIGADRERFPSADALAAQAGAAPVTRASGKSSIVGFRWACDHRLRQALTTFADNSRHGSPWADDTYRRARGRGADHPHAIRILAKAWSRVIWRCWQDRVPYDPARHGGLNRLVQTAA
jgi:transposase